MADIIAMFSRWAKSGLSALLDGSSSSSSSSSVEPTRGNALDDFQRIMRMLPRIEAVIEDAEEREIQDRSVKLWLSELRFLAYDIDDVIDEYEYDVLAAQMEARAAKESYHHGKRKRGDDERHYQDEKVEGLNKIASSSSQGPTISDGMVEKLREIRERFDEIERDRKGLHLREEDAMRRTVSAQNCRLTSSLVDESSIIGRESEKEKIVKLLLSDIQVSNKITVIPVVGMGGVGKTTLAQLIYNDPRIRQYFDLRIWIYVSEDFDLVKLTKEIYRSTTNKSCGEDVGFDYLQNSIKKELMKCKKTFLVLDDVWNEKPCLWESLQLPFHNTGIVKILLTTRSVQVADVMRTMNIFYLGFLFEEQGWQLFEQCALCDDENLMRIGKKIVKKCGGLPLAIKLLGNHLKFERREDKWMKILESELWDLDVGTNEIFPALRLSYQRMPIHLKPCFRYCSLFPKNNIPDKNRLVWLWMAQGYIQPNKTGKTIEEIGKEYFDELLGRSFLQAKEFEDSFNMHDLIFDLASFVSGNEFFTIKFGYGDQNKCVSNNVRHLAIYNPFAKKEVLKDALVYPFLGRFAALRSIFCSDQHIINHFQLLDSMRLRAVYIQDSFYGSSTIPSSIASLKHLRYLRCYDFKNDALSSLFNSLHSFRNVQVLDFLGCDPHKMLPTIIQNLINLRHLVLPYGSFMPCGISKLTCLQTLKYVVVMEDGSHKCGGLGEIEDLDNLTGSCCIQLIDDAYDFEDFKKANINRKKHIWRLCIDWHGMSDYFEGSFDVHISFKAMARVEKQSFELEKMKLDALRPHNNLKELEINGYPGIQFPLWLSDPSYSKLQDITLQGCDEWDGSDSVLDRDLPCLRSISIIDCGKLKNIKIVQSSSLKRLLIKQCPEIKTLHGLCNLHTLEKLEIIKCYNLLISVEERLPSKLQHVWFEDCWNLTSITGMQNLHSLEKLKLRKCLKLRLPLEEQLSTTPSVLEIADCPELEEWCQRYGFKTIQQELSKMEELTIRDTSHLIYYYGSKNLVSLKSLHLLESDEIDIFKAEWILCSLQTLHLNSCQRLMFFPPDLNFSALRLLKIWHCTALTCLPGLNMMESLEKLEIIECPQFTLSPDHSLPSKLHFLLISNCPNILCLPGLEQLFSLRNLRLFECPELMLPPPEQLPFTLQVQLELFNSPKLTDWCQRYDIGYNNKEESPKDIFVTNSEQIKLWLEEAYTFFENICVLDYDEAILETEKWPAFRLLGLYICSCVHLKSVSLRKNFIRLKQLRIWDCSHLKELLALERVTTLQDLNISSCPNLVFLGRLPKGLQSLAIDRCNKLNFLNCREMNLSSLEISFCQTLKLLTGLQEQASLHFLKISNCPRLRLYNELLPDMLNPNNVEIIACPQLREWCQKQDVAYIYSE
ncbi:hypothetical protein M5K25_001063 [Dendrobium thyrsiflorum]|uniref:Disease resistance protein RGA3 n=1 Tax=Dendrobium thyrsiflorum TaxID=117978 RepID=A0ABD0WAG6_DENTH